MDTRIATVTCSALMMACSLALATSPASTTGLVRYDKDARRFISDVQLQQLIDAALPPVVNRLLIFTQCFGGEFGNSTHFSGSNTATIAGTQPDQWGILGGFDEAAATSLAPAEGKTAQDLYNDAVEGRMKADVDGDGTIDIEENPVPPGGGLALNQFSLEPITETSAVQSRHVVIYAGQPMVKKRLHRTTGEFVLDENGNPEMVSDKADRDLIEANLAGQPNTTVHTVGGDPDPQSPASGQDGWDFPGTFDGLADAMYQVSLEIELSPDPSREQFILFIGDHGDRRTPWVTGNSASRVVVVPPVGRTVLGFDFPTPILNDENLRALRDDPDNQPSYQVFVMYAGNNVPINYTPEGDYIPFYQDGDFVLDVEPSGGGVMDVLSHFELVVDDGDDILGSQGDEGIYLRFDVPEEDWINHAGQTLEVGLTNNTLEGIVVDHLVSSTGDLAKGPWGQPIFRGNFETGNTTPWSNTVP